MPARPEKSGLYLRPLRQIEQTQESKKDNKQPIGKQHAENQSEEDTKRKGGKRERN